MQGLHKTGGNGDLTLKGITQNLISTGTKSKSGNFIGGWGLGQTYLLVLEDLLGRQGAAVAYSGVIKAGSGYIRE